MWSFDLGKAFALILRTLPFIWFRFAIYFGIALGYLIATGGGAGIGYVIGSILPDPEAAGGGAFWGGVIGFGAVSAVLYLTREYLLYVVKAGHIAVLVRLMDGQTLPKGWDQIRLATETVKARFIEVSVLFGVDQIIKGILRAFNHTVVNISRLLPIPGLTAVMGFVTRVISLSLSYADEAILAYHIRFPQTNPWAGARDGVVLYAQNYQTMLKNALPLAFVVWVLSFLIFLAVIAPVAALVTLIPGLGGIWTLLIAVVAAYSLKAALLDPLAMSCILQVYFKTIAGQIPDQEWVHKLNTISTQFRTLIEKAAAYVGQRSGFPASAARL